MMKNKGVVDGRGVGRETEREGGDDGTGEG